jgi:hypothetical protein
MGRNTKNEVNKDEEEDELLWKTHTDMAKPNGDEMVMIW